MSLIVSAAEILAAIGTDEDDLIDPIDAFVESYRRLHADGLTTKDIAARLGLSEHVARHRLRRARQAGLLPPGDNRYRSAPLADQWEHGTKAGYHRHQRRNQKPCDACCDGKRTYDQELKARQAEQAAQAAAYIEQWSEQQGIAS